MYFLVLLKHCGVAALKLCIYPYPSLCFSGETLSPSKVPGHLPTGPVGFMHTVRSSFASLHVAWCYSGATEINMSYLHCSCWLRVHSALLLSKQDYTLCVITLSAVCACLYSIGKSL